MGSGGNIKKIVRMADPVGYGLESAGRAVAKNNPDNKFAAFLAPGAYTQERYDSGEPVTPKLLGDPGALFTQTAAQKTKAQAEAVAQADAEQTSAENDATTAANNALIQRKRRRQSGLGSLATGAQGGTGQLSTANAYGKSSLGG